jgi:hypothetical protein
LRRIKKLFYIMCILWIHINMTLEYHVHSPVLYTSINEYMSICSEYKMHIYVIYIYQQTKLYKCINIRNKFYIYEYVYIYLIYEYLVYVFKLYILWAHIIRIYFTCTICTYITITCICIHIYIYYYIHIYMYIYKCIYIYL